MGAVSEGVDSNESIGQLWEAVWRQPWSMHVRSVMGDALQESGDAHGELIAVQLALERLPADDDEGEDTREVRDALEVRQQQLLRQLRGPLLGRFNGEMVWRAGFIDSARASDLAQLSALVECRAAWVIRELEYLGDLDDFRDLIRRFDDGRATTLETLRFGSRGEFLGCARVFKAKALSEALPRLKHLELWCARPDFRGMNALRLEHLVVDPRSGANEVLMSLGDAKCPALKSLTLALADGPEALPQAFLQTQGLEALEHLTLDGPFETQAVGRLLKARVAAHLKTLTVRLPSWLRWSESDLRVGEAFDRLERVELICAHLSATAARRLERSHPKLKVVHAP